jgi:hypothetical protein
VCPTPRHGPALDLFCLHRPPTLIALSTSSGNPALTLSKGRKGAQRRRTIVGGGSSVSFVRKTSDAGFVIPALTVQTDGIRDHGVFLQGRSKVSRVLKIVRIQRERMGRRGDRGRLDLPVARSWSRYGSRPTWRSTVR